MKKIAFVLIALFIALVFVFSSGTDLKNTGETKQQNPDVWIEIHDIGANYKIDALKGVMGILEKHPNAYNKSVLLVIPNYHGKAPFHLNNEFVEYLNFLEERGHKLSPHGYVHTQNEFRVSGNRTEEILNKSFEEFEMSGFNVSSEFVSPYWGYSRESLDVIMKYFDEVYTDNGVYIKGKFSRYPVHEYTEGSKSINYKLQLVKAIRDYRSSKGVFRLSMHLAFAYYPDHLKFLDAFLAWVEGDRNYLHEKLLNDSYKISKLEGPPGIKRVAYATLFNIRMYNVTGEEKFKEKAINYTLYLIEHQEENGMWKALPFEPRSSDDRLESIMGTWAVSGSYLTVLKSEDVKKSALQGADYLIWDTNRLRDPVFEYTRNLKPNILGYFAVALSNAYLVSGNAEYKDKAIELSDNLLEMQNIDGSWYDGPYHTTKYGDWKTISAWYQSMAWSGIAYTSYIIENTTLKEKYVEGVKGGIGYLENLQNPEGGYYGQLRSDGELNEYDGGTIMVLQGLAIANANGIDTKREYIPPLLYAEDRYDTWDGNLAFAYAEMLRSLDE